MRSPNVVSSLLSKRTDSSIFIPYHFSPIAPTIEDDLMDNANDLTLKKKSNT